MKEAPLMISLLVGLIVVLVIGGVSITVKMNSLTEVNKTQRVKNMSLEEAMDEISTENEALIKDNSRKKEEIVSLNLKLKDMEIEKQKIEKLKDRLEENLKEELMKKEETVKSK